MTNKICKSLLKSTLPYVHFTYHLKQPLELFLIFSDINLSDDHHLLTDSPVGRTATQGQALVLDPVVVDSLPALIPQWFEEKDGSFRRLSTSDPFYHVTYEGQLIVLDIKGQEDGKMFKAVSSNPVFPNENASVTYRLLVHKGAFGAIRSLSIS